MSDISCYNIHDGTPYRPKDVFILRGGVRCGWVRGQTQREYSKNYRAYASFITADFVAQLIIEADKPGLGVLHEASGYTWMRAWDKHEGAAVEQQIASAAELPSTAVFPCNWYTYAHHIKRDGDLRICTTLQIAGRW